MSTNLPPIITEARLRTSVSFYVMPDPLTLTKTLKGFGVSPFLSGLGAAIGTALTAITFKTDPTTNVNSIRNFSRDQNRTVTKRYALGVNSFEPFQVVPGPVTTKLQMERVILYKNDALKQVFGFWGENLATQQIPMLIIEAKSDPTNNIENIAAIMYTDCWMTSNPIEYDIDSEDLLIVQDREIEVGKVISIDSTLGGIAAAANLAINIGKEITIS